MTDDQAKIIVALRRSNAALTPTEIAKRTKLSATDVRSLCHGLKMQGYVAHHGGNYSLTRSERSAGA